MYIKWGKFKAVTQGCQKKPALNTLLCYFLSFFKTVFSFFQDLDFDGSSWNLFITWCYNHDIKTLLNHWGAHCCHFLIATVWPAKNTLNYSFEVTPNLHGFPPKKNSHMRCFQENPFKLYISRKVMKFTQSLIKIHSVLLIAFVGWQKLR